MLLLMMNFCTFRVEFYIRYGWDHLLVDPDRGVNVQKKLTNVAAQQPGSLSYTIISITAKAWRSTLDKAVGTTTYDNL